MWEEETIVEKIYYTFIGEILPRQEDVYESKYIYNFRKIDILLCKPERSASWSDIQPGTQGESNFQLDTFPIPVVVT